jgi:RNA polymerase sigma factor (sigma-70 family)
LRAVSSAAQQSDRDLVSAVRAGDERAFETLYARYRERIGVYVQGVLRDRGRAEDISQEVFISALRRLRETDGLIQFKPWIYEIAKNACIDELRRRGRRAAEISLEFEEEADRSERLQSPWPSPDVAIEGKQRLDDLRGAFRGLSESHHRILVLRELEGLSYNQISDRLGLSRPMVESTLFRARRRLGEEFAELESGRRCASVQEWIATAEQGTRRTPGARERRQFARHLSHCRACRIAARRAGIEDVLLPGPRAADGARGVGFGRVQIAREPAPD